MSIIISVAFYFCTTPRPQPSPCCPDYPRHEQLTLTWTSRATKHMGHYSNYTSNATYSPLCKQIIGFVMRLGDHARLLVDSPSKRRSYVGLCRRKYRHSRDPRSGEFHAITARCCQRPNIKFAGLFIVPTNNCLQICHGRADGALN